MNDLEQERGIEMPRRVITVCGIVQGVGFRPFVYGLASRLGLGGVVRNDGGRVVIEAEGEDRALDAFLLELSRRAPQRARVLDVSWLTRPEQGERTFSIGPSRVSIESVLVSPDIATCEECLAELFDPADRRFRYPLLSCTNCGPRVTIATAVPYDRTRTTMAAFAMCEACRREYEDPTDRRFHAQPIACPKCGPRMMVLDACGTPIVTDDPIDSAVRALLVGRIGALKGLGGFHLACDARSESAVGALRERKHRDGKPFAVMVRDLAIARQVCEVSPDEERLLTSPARPIVLLQKRPSRIVDAVAPHNACLGLMLPYTPLHHLLLQAAGEAPLVMTSGNRSDEPIAFDDSNAVERLSGVADFFLTHDRPIHLRCDDSLVRSVAGRPLPLRRSRGYAPLPIPLPMCCSQPILALGGHMKATFALGRGGDAILSHHLGDLGDYEIYRAYGEDIAHYERLFAVEPELIVHDLHPDYASTRYARERSRPAARLAIQHHHAHLASCLAENGLDEPVIGVIFDGAGLGDDGAVWGGEFLVGDYRGYRRAAHLRYVSMPGGEQAIREPWRMAVAHLLDAGLDCDLLRPEVPPKRMDTLRQVLARRLNTHMTSSIGRLFDAVASLAGVRSRVDYEGQAAMELEWLATETRSDRQYPFDLIPPAGDAPAQPLQIDTRPMVSAIAEDIRRGRPAAEIARRFHSTLVEIILRVCDVLREQSGLEAVALSGGVFMNALLLGEVAPALERQGFRVHRHERVPPNDGGLCLGQLAIAAALATRDNATGTPASGSSAGQR